MSNKITPAQVVKLQTLWSQHDRTSFDVVSDVASDSAAAARDRRLAWASTNCGRAIASFRDLTGKEAHALIELLDAELGPSTASQERAHAAGTEGRRRGGNNTATPITRRELDLIAERRVRLGWDEQRFAAWLRSSTSPLGRQSDPQICTVGDANRVLWALKKLLKDAGLWAASKSNMRAEA